jgi:hypothetical protein
MDIRECREEDLGLLEASRPSPGRTRGYARRFERCRRPSTIPGQTTAAIPGYRLAAKGPDRPCEVDAFHRRAEPRRVLRELGDDPPLWQQ